MRGVLIAGVLTCCVPAALAVDGVIEINHARALAGGVTPGDAPGYPVTLSQPGSYRLTGNLSQPSADTDVLQVANNVRNVNIDLNGFEIGGGNTCNYTPGPMALSCTAVGSGTGIQTFWDETHLNVRNGVIRGVGSMGIRSNGPLTADNLRIVHSGSYALLGGAALIRNVMVYRNGRGVGTANGEISQVRVLENGGDAGIECSGACVITHNVVKNNIGNGITVMNDFGGGAVLAHNIVSSNKIMGMVVNGGHVVGNSVFSNLDGGLYINNSAGRRTSYLNNVFHGNNAGGAQLSSSDGNLSHNLGGNLCQGALCP